MEEQIGQVLQRVMDNGTQTIDSVRVSRDVPGGELCQIIHNIRFATSRYDNDEQRWVCRDVVDRDIVSMTNQELRRRSYADAPAERIVRALRHVEHVRAEHSRAEAIDALAKTVGPRYGECTLDNYHIECEAQRKAVAMIREYVVEAAERLKVGANVILFGPSGTGKDHLAIGLAREIISANVRVTWRNGRDLFGAFRDAMDGDKESETDILRPLWKPDVLLISDPLPPSGPLTAYQQDILYRVVDSRYRLRRPVWLTLNVHNGQEADERIGVPIVDRLRHGALVLKCDWPSYRKPME